MTDQTRLDDLLLRYEELRAQEVAVTAEELCRDCPELLEEVKQQIRMLASMNAILDAAKGDEPECTTSNTNSSRLDSSPWSTATAVATASRYGVLRFHARGGLGEVYVAEDQELHRPVAVKRLQTHHAGNPYSRSRFLWEAEITSRLEHPSIVPIHGVGQDAAGSPFYTMRFVQGETLAAAIERFHASEKPKRDSRERRLALRQLLNRLVAVCNTAAYAHSRGILHRDIKPSNIMLGPYGETLVVDWGLAKVIGVRGQGSDVRSQEPEVGEGGAKIDTSSVTPDSWPLTTDPTAVTQEGQALGTAAFMSPEQAEGRSDLIGPASDVYSLGATLYTLLTGEPPFQGRNAGEILVMVKRGDFVPPRRRKKDIPPALEAVCLKAMAHRPEERYSSALDLAAELERWLADDPVSAWREPWTVRTGRWMRRHRAGVMAAATAVVMAFVCLGGAAGLLLAAYREAKQQRDEASIQRDRAREHFKMAREAVDQFDTRVSERKELRAHGLESLRRELLQSAVDFYQRFAQQQGDDLEVQAERGRAYLRLADLSRKLGKNAAAEEAYQQARAIFADLAKAHLEEPVYRRDLARSHARLGLLLATTARSDLAEQMQQQARDLFAELCAAHPQDLEYQQELGSCDYNLGRHYYNTGRAEQAEQVYLKALETHKGVADLQPTDLKAQFNLVELRGSLAILYRSRGRLDLAERAYLENQVVLMRLTAAEPQEPNFQQSLASCLVNLANNYKETERMDQAEEAFRHGRDLLQKLADTHPLVEEYQLLVAHTVNNLGGLYRNTERTDLALKMYRDARRVYSRLAEAHPEVPSYSVYCCGTDSNIGPMLTELDKPQDTLDIYAQAISRLEGVLQQDARQASAREVLLMIVGGRAIALAKLGRQREADKDLEWVARLDEELRRGGIKFFGGYNVNHFRAWVLVYRGDHAHAVEEANLVTRNKTTGLSFFQLARVCSLAAAAAQQDGKLSSIERERLCQNYAANAVQLLRQAQKGGYFRAPAAVERLKKDRQLNAVRSRGDFRKLVEEVEAKTKP